MMTTQTTIVIRLVRVERIVIVFVGVAVLAVALLVAPGIPWVVAGGRSGRRNRVGTNRWHVTVASEPERIGVFLTRSCVHVTDISCGVVYEATLASLVLFRSYCYVPHARMCL